MAGLGVKQRFIRRTQSSRVSGGLYINSGVTMDNNKWERRLDNYLDGLEGPLAAIPEIKQRWGTIASVLATPFATLLFLLKAIITSPWGIFLVLARFLER